MVDSAGKVTLSPGKLFSIQSRTKFNLEAYSHLGSSQTNAPLPFGSMYLIPSICGSTRKPALHNIYEFSEIDVFYPVFPSLRWHGPLTTGCRTSAPQGWLAFVPELPLLSISGWGVWEWGPRYRCKFAAVSRNVKNYLKLNIVSSVACLWISLKLHRCISTSLGCRCKNKVICTILRWFCRWGAPVILRVKKQSLLFTSLTETVTFYGIKS